MEREPGSGMRLTLIVCGIVMLLGIGVFFNYRKTLEQQAANVERLPIQAQLDRSLGGINQRGEPVSFEELRGKVWVLAYVYTDCPVGCEPLNRKLKELQQEFAGVENVHFVTLSLDPDRDTPERLAAWAQADGRGMGEGNWWFMTGVAKEVRTYMGKYFRLYVTPRKDLAEVDIYGQWEVEYPLMLVDQAGAIRRRYDVLDARVGAFHEKTLREDVRNLLEHGHQFGGPGRNP